MINRKKIIIASAIGFVIWGLTIYINLGYYDWT